VKRLSILAVLAVAFASMAAADLADARRMGGGRSFGMQRQGVAPSAPAPSAAPSSPAGAASNPVMPANPSTVAPRAAPAAPAAAPSGMSRWLGPIAGIAAGIGLAALLSHFGLSEAFASFLLIALVIVAGVVLLRWLFARRQAAPAPMRYAPAGAGQAPRGYDNRVEPSWGGGASAAAAAAWDAGDRTALADVMTPSMYAEIERDLASRVAHQPSEVATLDANLIEVTTEGNQHVASIRFHGLMREDGATTPQPFDEVWNLQKPVDGSSGWLLAGIQQLEQAA
jgi:predicted lipid-binding transport protein (Tim44 family)